METPIESSEIKCVVDELLPHYNVLLANREAQQPPDDAALCGIKQGIDRLNVLLQSEV